MAFLERTEGLTTIRSHLGGQHSNQMQVEAQHNSEAVRWFTVREGNSVEEATFPPAEV